MEGQHARSMRSVTAIHTRGPTVGGNASMNEAGQLAPSVVRILRELYRQLLLVAAMPTAAQSQLTPDRVDRTHDLLPWDRNAP